MKGHTMFRICWLMLLSLAGIVALTGCSADTLQVGIKATATLPPTPAPSPSFEATIPTPSPSPEPTTASPSPSPESTTPTISTLSPPNVEESLAVYTDDAYHLTFQYPAGWVIQERGDRFVRLGQEPLSLYIGYMGVWESVNIWGRSGMPAGELQSQGTATILDQILTRNVLVYEGKELVVFYGQPGSLIMAGDLVLAIYLDDLSPNGPAGIPEDFQDAADQVVESLTLMPEEPPVTDLPVVGWYGSVHSLPSTARFDDYLSLQPEGAGEVGLVGASAAVESEIETLRDMEEPGSFAHFWGSLTCGVSDYAGCQLLVTHLRPDGPGPLLNPDPVEAWEGTVITNSAWAQIDNAFVLSGDYPVHYGIWSEDPKMAESIAGYRNSGILIRIWGQVTCGVMDANGCQIIVNRLEEIPTPISSMGRSDSASQTP